MIFFGCGGFVTWGCFRRRHRPRDGVGRLLELLMVADYLQLDHLKQTAERMCISWGVIQVENVLHVYQHAAGASCAQLRATCVQYVRGMFDVVSMTQAWQSLDEKPVEYRQTDRQTDRQTVRQTYRQTDGRTDRHKRGGGAGNYVHQNSSTKLEKKRNNSLDPGTLVDRLVLRVLRQPQKVLKAIFGCKTVIFRKCHFYFEKTDRFEGRRAMWERANRPHIDTRRFQEKTNMLLRRYRCSINCEHTKQRPAIIIAYLWCAVKSFKVEDDKKGDLQI